MALIAVAVLFCLPATSFAASDRGADGSRTKQGESSVTALKSAGLLSRGSGYGGGQAGSKAVRQLQVRLRSLGRRPGPIDGLFGPLTEASVERFQRARGLRVDGVVGPRTRARLVAVPVRRPAAPHGSAAPKPGTPDRQAPSRPAPADVSPPRHPAPDAPVRPALRAPESSGSLSPWLAAALGALAMGVLLAGLSRFGPRRRRDRVAERHTPAPVSPRGQLNMGMVFAVLLAVFAVGAAIGALFATRAAPGDRDGAEVASGALLSPSRAAPVQSTRAAEPPSKSRPAVAARPRPQRAATLPSDSAPAPAPEPAATNLPRPERTPRPGPAAPTAPAARAPADEAIYTAPPADAARNPIPGNQPEAETSDAALARAANLVDPDLLAAREKPTPP